MDWPCGEVAGVVTLDGASIDSVLDTTDAERWTGMGDLPTELVAMELSTADEVFFRVEYPEPHLGTSTDYWMRVHWLDAHCQMTFGTGHNGGTVDTDVVVSQFLPTSAGVWYAMLFFPEAMVQPGSIAYEASLHSEYPN